MKLQLTKGTTSKLLAVFIRDTRSNAGAGLTGLVFNSASLTAYYWREDSTTATAITLATMTLGTFTSSGFKEMDATNMPGWYQFCPPNAALASGANWVTFHLQGAANMVPLTVECQLQNMDPYDGVRAGLTALPNAAAGATGGTDCTVIFGGTASAGSATSLTLAGASATDNLYNHLMLRILSGTGAGQIRVIAAYNGTTKVATVGRNWTTTPDNTSVFAVTGPEQMLAWNLFQGLASAGGATSVTLTGGSATSSIYNGSLAVIVAGTGARQARVITAYNGGTGVVTVDRAWQTNPDSTSVVLIIAADLPGADGAGNLSGSVASVVGAAGSVTAAVTLAAADSLVTDSGTAQAGGASTITLRAGASATDDLYTGEVVRLTGGNGAGQARTITAYVGATKVATVGRAWVTNPDNTSVYAVAGLAVPKVNSSLEVVAASVTGAVASVTADVGITQAGADKVWGTASRTLSAFAFAVDISAAAVTLIWDKATSALTTAGSIGKLLVDNINATISSRSTVTTAQVKTQVTDALAVDTQTELTAVPSSTPTYSQIMRWLYLVARNKLTQDKNTGIQTVRNNADAADVGTTTTGDDGTTATRGKWS